MLGAVEDTRCATRGVIPHTEDDGLRVTRDARCWALWRTRGAWAWLTGETRRAGRVYRYGAYAYTLDGQPVTQPVTDRAGENPMAGRQFTYEIRLDPAQTQGDQMMLVNVLTDTP